MRNTKARKRLISLLESMDKALSAQEIYEKIKDIDLATVYRNLNLFVSEGIVRELRIQKGESLYEINNDGHEHAICTECGKVKHIKVNKQAIINQINLPDFNIDDIEVNIKGHCIQN